MSLTDPDDAVELLLVEDNHDDARFIERLIHERQSTLEREGTDAPIEIAAIDHVDHLEAALERIRTDSPDVVLLDLLLPDSRGLETIERVIEYAPDLPIVVVTGQNETDTGIEAIQCGAQEYLSKGTVTGETILRTLRYALERSRHQRELVDRNHRLALLNRIVRQDIRNDVSMIVGLGDQLQDGIDPNDERTLELLLDAADHAVDLTDTAAAVIDVIAADSVEHDPCDLHAILEPEVTRMQQTHNVELTFERADPDEGPVIVRASPMLGSVFEHLLDNAVSHSDQPTPQVTVTLETTETNVTVTICDDGIGIPDAQKQALADPNARFSARSGMGVGLYLVTTLLESFGGHLEITDNDPRGTQVAVTLERELL
ncbi:response regulator [Natronolimnobius sp. AArcel1]|uniref:hybrid sensor histidine kinase/response regulator n=1 Tax=Natronolimnobius sp. AArcel1 TaxID=1679093 RepID=UPI0013ECC1DA|nr:hybrid sensor histidine kinase/response regulator [Natronolimnobius sp. AArcel1]NGM70516.1 response regulator [Natronolimnobius sp. AArcel1]